MIFLEHTCTPFKGLCNQILERIFFSIFALIQYLYPNSQTAQVLLLFSQLIFFGVSLYILQAWGSNTALIWPWIECIVVCYETIKQFPTTNQSEPKWAYDLTIFQQLTVHKSRTSTTVDGWSPISDHCAVTDACVDPLFHRITATLPLISGPAHTYMFRSQRMIQLYS